MAFHYYTGSDISEQREPAFWRREPRWPIGTFDGPATMAMAGNCQNGKAGDCQNGREGHSRLWDMQGICQKSQWDRAIFIPG